MQEGVCVSSRMTGDECGDREGTLPGPRKANVREKSTSRGTGKSSCPGEASVAELRLRVEGKSEKQDPLRNNSEVMRGFEARQPMIR